MYELLSQDTRHYIIQTLLGHPDHMASPGSLLLQLEERGVNPRPARHTGKHDIVATYTHGDGQNKWGVSGTLYGLTEHGTHLMDGFEYLRGVAALRTIHHNTVKPDRIRRHEVASRPHLPSELLKSRIAHLNQS